MRASKLSVMVGLVFALAIVSAPEVSANCGSNKVFSSAKSAGTPNMRLTPGEVGQGVSNAIGRWWDSENANLTSNFGPNAGTCDSVNWWFQLANGNMFIDGVLDNPAVGCLGYSGCPGAEMTVVVEDYGAAGPPGDGGTAYYAGWRVDDTPATLRRYNFGRTCNCTDATNNLRPFSPFPEVVLTAQSPPDLEIHFTYDLADQSANVLTATGPNNLPLPTDSVVSEWQLVVHTGVSDPGRDRIHWTILDRIPYQDGGKFDNFATVSCESIQTDEFVAIGIGFNGGAAGVIDSALVGRAWQIECDPTIADPDGDRPTVTRPGVLHQPEPRIRGRR